MISNEVLLENLYNELKPVLIKLDGTLISHAEAELKHDELLEISMRFMNNYCADSIDELFEAYNSAVVDVLVSAGIIPKNGVRQ